MDVVLYKKEANKSTLSRFQIVKLLSHQNQTIQIQTDSWFPSGIGISYFVKIDGLEGSLALVEFEENQQMSPPYIFVDTIDTNIQYSTSNIGSDS